LKLRVVHISRLPGIDVPFTVEDLDEGFNIISGPNAIGKSSLCRVVLSLLWPGHSSATHMIASAQFEDDGEQWLVEMDGARHGWQCNGLESNPPRLPSDHLGGCFFLRLPELIESSRSAGRDVAEEIRRQMSGGFDLETVTDGFAKSAGPRIGKTERNKLTEAENAVRRADVAQSGLASQEAELDDLREHVRQAEGAQRSLYHVEKAIELQGHREKLTGLEQDLGLMPSALQHLTGKELDEVVTRMGELEENDRLLRLAASELEQAQELAEETRLSERVEPAVLSTARSHADSLADLESRLGLAQVDWQGKREALHKASQFVGGTGDPPADLELTADAELFDLLRQLHTAKSEVEGIDVRLNLLSDTDISQDDEDHIGRVQRGVHSLRAWLRSPEPGVHSSSHSRRTPRKSLFGIAGVVFVAGTALGLLIHPVFFAVMGVGIGLAIATWLATASPNKVEVSLDTRKIHQSEFPTNINPPKSWSQENVLARLLELETELAALKAAERQRSYREADRASLNSERKAAERRQSELDVDRKKLAEKLGLEEIPPDADLVNMAGGLHQLRQAHQDEQKAQGIVKELEKESSDLLQKIVTVTVSHRETEPTDAASARAAVASLEKRDQDLHSALTAAAGAESQLKLLEQTLSKIKGIIEEIYQIAGLETDDRAGLTFLIGELEKYKRLKTERDSLAETMRSLEADLRSYDAADLVDRDRSELEGEEQRLKELASRVTDLHHTVAEINANVTKAKEGHDLEELIAKRSAAIETLGYRRDEVLCGAAGEFLMRKVGKEHEVKQIPAVLERAREFFSIFTHDSYQLRVSNDHADSFVAVDSRTGRGVHPHELSDGTRAQLLLAVRLAFAEEAEQGVRLPLFLDEALDQSDPERYEAIVQSLGRLVTDEGRQILYLTNDPTDVVRIQEALAKESCAEPKIIDLAEVRQRGVSITNPDDLRVEPLPTVPSPDNMTAEDYGAALGVSPLILERGHADQHLLYILWDDLQILHTLLTNHIEYVGNWLALSARNAALARSIAAKDGAGSQLDARSQLLEAFCEAWMEGRGRRVDSEVIGRSGEITQRYLDAVVEIAKELGGDSERLIQMLRSGGDERLRRFHKKATDGLEAYLTDIGYLDPRPVLDESTVLTRVLASPAAARLPTEVSSTYIHRWWMLAKDRESNGP